MQLAALLAGALAASGHSAPPPSSEDFTSQIIREGRDRSQAYKTLRDLSLGIGPRATGSTSLVKAQAWAMDMFRKAGVDAVWKEEWGVVPETWTRGPRQSVRMVSPYVREMVFSTPVLTCGTRGRVRGPIAVMPKTLEEFEKVKSSLKGAFILMPKQAGMGGPPWKERDPVDVKLDEAGIAGRVYGTTGDLVWTSGAWTKWTPQNRPKTPLIMVRKSDFQIASINVEKGRKPVLEAEIENRITPRPIRQHNVVAEIRGAVKPEESVILCGHLDSWDGPGSTGTSDNGTGSCTVLEAARILGRLRHKPYRTIRFILWSGEEQGLLGSAGYVKAHADTLDKISAVFNEDGGQNAQGSITVLPSMKPMIDRAEKPMAEAFPDLPIAVNTTERMRAGGGSDHASFVRVGVPAFAFGKIPGKPYTYIWHTQNDNILQVEDRWLRQMATHMSLLAWSVANEPGLMPRDGLTGQQP